MNEVRPSTAVTSLSEPAASPSESATIPYDYWDTYQARWREKPAYAVQERVLREVLAGLANPASPGLGASGPIQNVLEVGPGFGRITQIVMDMWPLLASSRRRTRARIGPDGLPLSKAGRPPKTPKAASYYALDVTSKGLDAAEQALGFRFTGRIVSPIQNQALVDPDTLTFGGPPLQPSPMPPMDLVLAIEVLLHVSPAEIEAAIYNLLAAADRPGLASRSSGRVVTCDWTTLQPGKSEEAFNAGGNWRHDYTKLFRSLGARVITERHVGFQTIYVVQP